MKRINEQPEDSRGLAIVEFAIAIALFLLLMSGIFDYSMAIREQSVMADAARTAARGES